MKRVLILGGTEESRMLAAKLAIQPNIRVITSLAGRTQTPTLPPGQVRIGGFGGTQGLVDYLQAQAIDLLIDATHPFAAQISWQAAESAAIVGIPRLVLVRPVWQQTPADHWIEVESIEAAAEKLPHLAQRVFLTIGRQELAAFAHLQQMWFLMRMIEPPLAEAQVPPGIILLEQGPFTEADEQALLSQYDITAIVTKNSGGNATAAKLKAARTLGILVVMVNRPPMPNSEEMPTVEDALQWIVNRSE